MEHNPYAPPKAPVGIPTGPAVSASDPSTPVPASRRRRFCNLLIDVAGYYLLAIVLGFIIGLVQPGLLDHLNDPAAEYIFGGVITVLYYLPSEALFGCTLGKLITRTRVVSESGGPATFAQILRRTLLRLIPFEAFTFIPKRGIGLHDRWSATRVTRIYTD